MLSSYQYSTWNAVVIPLQYSCDDVVTPRLTSYKMIFEVFQPV